MMLLPNNDSTKNEKSLDSRLSKKLHKRDNYPATKIIIVYILFGGAVGGFLTSIPLALIDNTNIFEWIVKSMVVGALAGLVPSCCTALILVYQRTILFKFQDWCKVFLIGMLMTVLFVFAGLLVIAKGSIGAIMLGIMMSFLDFIIILGVISGIGGLSSLILGSIVLPKN